MQRENMYRVEILGNGTLVYQALKPEGVLVAGRHQDHISQQEISRLLEQFRRVDFFSLSSEYASKECRRSSPTALISLSVDGQSKSVADYCGELVGMPWAVSDLEDAIESQPAVQEWVSGTAETIPALRREGFDFKSGAASEMLVRVLRGDQTQEALQIAHDLLAAGTPVRKLNARDGDCFLALAAEWQDEYLVRVALQNGGDNGKKSCRTMALANAAKADPAKALVLLHMLLGPGVNPNLSYQWEGTPLMTAAKAGNLEVVAELLKYNPDLNSVDAFQHTALIFAAGKCQGETDDQQRKDAVAREQIVRMLLEAGANPNQTDQFGQTPLHHACTPQIAQALIDGGAKIDYQDDDDETPVFVNHHPDVLKLLIASGANLSIRNKHGRTALQNILQVKKDYKGLNDIGEQLLAILERASLHR
jgi:ankyrin repeat protein